MKNTILLTSGCKLGSYKQYPKGTEYIYSVLVPRDVKYNPLELRNRVVVFGIQYLIKEYLIKQFNEGFFSKPKDVAVSELWKRVDSFLGHNNVSTKHIEELYDLGYLPIRIKALPEGTLCPIGVPVLTITNTNPNFFWLTDYLKPLISATLWLPMTSATIARLYKKKLLGHLITTGCLIANLTYFVYDFSMEGMEGIEAATMSGMGYLTSFLGSDTTPAIEALEEYYNAGTSGKIIAYAIPTIDYNLLSEGNDQDNDDTFQRLITEIYPSGNISVVLDTPDFWWVINELLPKLKDVIKSRKGRVILRINDEDPDIICGIKDCDIAKFKGIEYYIKGIAGADSITREMTYRELDNLLGDLKYKCIEPYQKKGAYEMLWDIFGGDISILGYKVLDPHIGIIYGGSTSLADQEKIYDRLMEKGFSAGSLILGIGSDVYQNKSKDSPEFTFETTWLQISGHEKDIAKGSLGGLIKVEYSQVCEKLFVATNVSKKEEQEGELDTVFEDGKLLKDWTLEEIRDNVDKSL